MGRIDVIDMAAPDHPLFMSIWSSAKGLNVTDIDVQQGQLYCAAYGGGILVLNGADIGRLELDAEYDWDQERSLAIGIAAVPPYVFVARSDAVGAAGSFQAFRHDRNSLTLIWEQAAQFPVHSVAVWGNLFITIEQELPFTAWPKKIIKLYRIFAE